MFASAWALLAATTAIEGVDAHVSLMVIEHAERFGSCNCTSCAGAWGAGGGQPGGLACVAVLGGRQRQASVNGKRAPACMAAETNDGFEIAWRDLETRKFGRILEPANRGGYVALCRSGARHGPVGVGAGTGPADAAAVSAPSAAAH